MIPNLIYRLASSLEYTNDASDHAQTLQNAICGLEDLDLMLGHGFGLSRADAALIRHAEAILQDGPSA